MSEKINPNASKNSTVTSIADGMFPPNRPTKSKKDYKLKRQTIDYGVIPQIWSAGKKVSENKLWCFFEFVIWLLNNNLGSCICVCLYCGLFKPICGMVNNANYIGGGSRTMEGRKWISTKFGEKNCYKEWKRGCFGKNYWFAIMGMCNQ